jgi:hypothetical protein
MSEYIAVIDFTAEMLIVLESETAEHCTVPRRQCSDSANFHYLCSVLTPHCKTARQPIRGFLIVLAWRVLRLRLQDTAFRYGG